MQSYLKFFILVVLLVANVSSNPKEQAISFQLGQVYRQSIPIVFNNYQQSTLRSFRNIKRNYTVPLQICQIRVKQQGNLSQRVRLNYSSSVSKYESNKVIYRLKDLQQSKIVTDSISINQQIIALFPPNQVIIYSVDNQNAGIRQQLEFKINVTIQDQLLQALFIEINNTVLLISSKHIRKINTNGNWQFLKGYNAVTSTVTSLQYVQRRLYLGMGEHGLSIYQLDSTLSSATLAIKTQFFYTENNQSVSFDVDQFQIYPTQGQIKPSARSIYVLDYVQGLIQIALDKIKPEKTLTAKPRYLASSCRNLILYWNSIFLTCPEIVEISRSNYAFEMMKQTSFLSQSVKIQKDRLYLFGRQDFAVYDIFGRSLAEYQLPYQSQLSSLVMGYLLTFGRQNIILHSIIPQKQQLYCLSHDLNRVGEYTGYIQTGGICKQYSGSAQITRKIGQIYCLVEYPIRVNFKNSAKINLETQLTVGGVILLVCLFFGLYLAYKHCQARSIYGRLNEQQFRQVRDVGSQIMSNLGEKQRKEAVEIPLD